ncbi:hypothetical protein Tco_0908804 [Tanacetum coccineum]|uniref:Uncharacterized protein n=1 Tax=Tanacetum coccineum TaxID=301880 RepID=A0ABQ5CUM2_9ASTR
MTPLSSSIPQYHLQLPYPTIRDTTTSTYTITYIITTFAFTPTDRRADMPEVCLPPWKRLCIALGLRYETLKGWMRCLWACQGTIDLMTHSWVTVDRVLHYGLARTQTRSMDIDEAQMLARCQNFPVRPRGWSLDASGIANSEVRVLAELQHMCETRAKSQQGLVAVLAQSKIPEEASLINQGVVDAWQHGDIERANMAKDSHDSGVHGCKEYLALLLTVGHDVAYAMTWTNLKKKMTDNYCPRARMSLSSGGLEMWNLKIVDYVGGLPGYDHGSVMEIKPKTMQDAIEFSTELMD